jgi:GT2 family glycosyltransferase
MRNVWSRIDHFFAPSQCMLERFVAAGIPRDRISRSDYGFDHTRFEVKGAAPRKGVRPLKIGFLGSLMVSKGPHVLLEAFRRLPAGAASLDLFGSHCGYHGDTSYEKQIEPLLATPGVSFRGPLPYRDVPAALSSIDVLAVPSIWQENSPLVIREAFLAGIPVVASAIGGIPEAVTDGTNGLLFSPGDSADLARALMRLLDEPGLIDRLRSGFPPVRTIEDDVSVARQAYETHIRKRAVPASTVRRPAPSVAAIVLNYRTADDTLLAVQSLLAANRPPAHVLVVNNSREDGCRTALDSVRDRVEYIETDRNLGFSGGMNIGVRRALAKGVDRVLLVNSDVVIPPDCLEWLEDGFVRAGVGIVGPAVLSRTDPGSVASLGMTYRARSGRMVHADYGSRFDPGRSNVGVVDGVSGCLMMVSREVFDRVGLLDEDYFFSFEDLDFCLRAKRAGYLTVVHERARAYHEGSRAIGPLSNARLYFAARNHLLMAERHAPRGALAAAWRSSTVLALNLAHAVMSGSGSPAGRLWSVGRGARDYLARRFGDCRD